MDYTRKELIKKYFEIKKEIDKYEDAETPRKAVPKISALRSSFATVFPDTMEGMEAYAVLDKHFPRIEKYPLLPNTKTEIETNKKILETIQEIIGKDIIKTVEKLKLEQELKTLMDTEEI